MQLRVKISISCGRLKEVKKGDEIEVRLDDGVLNCVVEGKR